MTEIQEFQKDEGKRKAGEYPWDYYLRRSLEVASRFKNPKILKTDADNEACDLPRPGGIAGNLEGEVTIIEYVKEIIDKARVKCPSLNYVLGDIRSLPFPEDSFDLLIDASTLDHIHPKDVLLTLQEYHRVLKKGGVCLLFDWVTNNPKYADEYKGYTVWSPTHQYYHPESEVDAYFNSLFSLEEKDHFWSVSDIHMNCYIGIKI